MIVCAYFFIFYLFTSLDSVLYIDSNGHSLSLMVCIFSKKYNVSMHTMVYPGRCRRLETPLARLLQAMSPRSSAWWPVGPSETEGEGLYVEPDTRTQIWSIAMMPCCSEFSFENLCIKTCTPCQCINPVYRWDNHAFGLIACTSAR